MYHPRGGRARLPAVPGDRRRRRRAGGARSRQPSVSALPALWTPGAPRPPRLAALPALRPAVPPQREPRSLILRQIRRVDPARLEQAAQLSESRHLELPHALAAEREPLSDRLQRFRRIALEPEAPPQHRALVGGEVVQHGGEIRAGAEETGERLRGRPRAVGDEVAERGRRVRTHRRVERDRVLAHLLQLRDLSLTGAQRLRQLLGGGRPAQRLREPPPLANVAREQQL